MRHERSESFALAFCHRLAKPEQFREYKRRERSGRTFLWLRPLQLHPTGVACGHGWLPASGNGIHAKTDFNQQEATLSTGKLMTKAQIIDILAEGTGLTKVETAAVIDGFLATINWAVSQNKRVTLRGFGSFQPVQRRARL